MREIGLTNRVRGGVVQILGRFDDEARGGVTAHGDYRFRKVLGPRNTDRAREDLEAIGDWEYKVQYFSNVNHIALEKKLNELGTERWEVIWIDRQGPNLIVTMKRPSRTWLNKLPLGQLLKAAAPGSDGGE